MTTALLVIDVQNVFKEMTNTALPNIQTLISHFRTQSLPILFTQHGHPPSDLKPPFKNQLVRKWGPAGSIATGSSDWEFLPAISEIIEKHNYPIIPKTTYDAFINTDLEERLRERDVQRVVVCGVMTDCCCDTTARSAFNRGWETWLVRDACGSANKMQHEAGLRGFGFAFGEVLGTKEVLERLG